MNTTHVIGITRTVILMAALIVSIPSVRKSAYAQTRIPFSNKSVFLSGANVAWVSFAGDLGPRSASSPNSVNFSKFQSIFQTVHQNGGNVMRLWLFTNGVNTPAFGSNGYVTGPGPYAIKDLRKILNIAQQNNIGLILCLWSFDMMENPPSENLTATQQNDNYELLTDTSYTMAFIRNALVPMVDSVKDNPAIVAWEIFNEPEGMTPVIGWGGLKQVQITDVQRCVNLMAGAIHRADPGALVTSGAVGFLSITDVTPLLAAKKSALKEINSISPQQLHRITEDFNATHRLNLSDSAMQAFMNRTASTTYYDYYRDDRLIAAGGDPQGTLDFYSVHYYTWEGALVAPFLVPCSTWKISKPVVIGEFMFSNLLASSLFNNLTWNSVYQGIYSNGYAGALDWSYSSGGAEQSQMLQSLSIMHDSYPQEVGINIVNKALDAVATASSNNTAGDSTSSPANITDGNTSTRWQADNSPTQWVQIDLGQPDSIGRIEIYWADHTFARQDSITVSNDGTNWSLLASVNPSSVESDGVETIEGLSGEGRFVRFNFSDPASGPYSISEIQIYGDSASVDSIVPTTHTVPVSFALNQNYPNPFNPTTIISYDLPASSYVMLRVYDVLGRYVETIASGTEKAGNHLVTFDGKNLPSGVYFYRIETPDYMATRKMLLLK